MAAFICVGLAPPIADNPPKPRFVTFVPCALWGRSLQLDAMFDGAASSSFVEGAMHDWATEVSRHTEVNI